MAGQRKAKMRDAQGKLHGIFEALLPLLRQTATEHPTATEKTLAKHRIRWFFCPV
ncbi:hypothetical protein [Nitrospira moscoviensis]|jgi:hypothetical protein|uniref:hypothetical protein n=1 Tax=Nitrospira moscoviensis TaxID=42253 RepID=UPI001650D4B5|nr:hypothetical protein [Nitrospira moscoviensis]